MNLKIGIDCTWYKSGKAVGYNSYVNSLLLGLMNYSEKYNISFTIFHSDTESIFFKKFCSRNISTYSVKVDSAFKRFLWLIFICPFYYKNYSSILFTSGFLGIFCTKRKFLVLHDFNYMHFPANFNFFQLWFRRLYVYISCLFADKIICISQTVKSSCYPKFLHKCIVIYNSVERSAVDHENVSNELISLIDNLHGLVKIVIPSSLGAHKNLNNTCLAAANIGADYEKLVLIMIGNWSLLPLDFEKSDKIIPLGYVSEADKNFLLKNCDIVLVPSIYEGFGMPYIEAIFHKKLLVACDIEVCREITYDYPFFIKSPFDSNSIKVALESAVNFFVSNQIRPQPDITKFSNRSMALNYIKEILKESKND